MSVGPGKTAPKFLEDLISYDPRYEADAGRNVLTDLPPPFDPDATAPRSEVPRGSCRHAFMIKYEQSELARPGESPSNSTYYKVACYCNNCRFHFDVIADFRAAEYAFYANPCPHDDYKLHHLLHQPDDDANTHLNGTPSLVPQDTTYKFACTAPECPLVLRIRIRPPIFKSAWVDLLTNVGNLNLRLASAMHADPDRSDMQAARPVEGLHYLSRYLKDALDPNTTKRRIPLRNKKFTVTFGQDCDHVLTEFGFTRVGSDDSNGFFWELPDVANSPMNDDLRVKVQDVLEELRVLIAKKPAAELKASNIVKVEGTPCQVELERLLGCLDYSKSAKSRSQSNSTHPPHPHYGTLGALDDFSDELIIFAHKRQADNDPQHRDYYFECLENLAAGRQSETLQMEVAMLASQGQSSRATVQQAYRYFGIDPNASSTSDPFIISQFKARLQDVSAGQVGEMRKQLKIIGEARQSTDILREAAETIEDYKGALEYLEASADVTDEFIITFACVKGGQANANQESVRKAVQIIADQRDSAQLRHWLATDGEGGGTASMDVEEAYRIYGITDRTASIDQEVLQVTMEQGIEENPAQADKYRAAYQVLSNSKLNGNFIEDTDNKHDPKDWPVGVGNIGNSCFLCFLQFFFTIVPLRQFVLHYEAHDVDPFKEQLDRRTVGGRKISLEELRHAQEFVLELKKLFSEMVTSPKKAVYPSKRLGSLVRPPSKRKDSEKPSETIDTNDKSSDKSPNESSSMSDHAQSSSNESTEKPKENTPGDTDTMKVELADFESDQTLVEEETRKVSDPVKPAAPAQQSVIDIEGKATVSEAVDVEMQDDSENVTANERPEQPDRPPPVPPRPNNASDQKKSEESEVISSQEDLAEIMLHVIFHLQCVSILLPKTDSSEDLTKRLFYSNIISSLQRHGQPTVSEKTEDHCQLSFPLGDGPWDLYAVLDRYFGRNEIEDASPPQTTYSTISRLPPLFVLQPKRIGYNREDSRYFRINHHLVLPQEIYLDRYLLQTEKISKEELLDRRTRSWDMEAKLREHRERIAEIDSLGENGADLPETLRILSQYFDTDGTTQVDADGETDSESEIAVRVKQELEIKEQALRQEREQLLSEVKDIERQVATLFSDLNAKPYKLHAVFTHKGDFEKGHYWANIKDYQNGIWRKYNDERVTEISVEKVLAEDDISADRPAVTAGFVYVSDEYIHELTKALYRHPIDADTHMSGLDDDKKSVEVLEGVEPKDPQN